MYLFINSLLVLISGVLLFFVLTFYLTPKKSRLQTTLLYCPLLYIPVFFKCAVTNTMVSALFGLCNVLVLFAYTIFAFHNSFWRKLIMCLLILGLTFPTEAVFSAFLHYVLHTTLTINYYSGAMTPFLLLSDFFVLISCTLLIFLTKPLKRFLRKGRFRSTALFVFMHLVTLTILLIMCLPDISAQNRPFSLLTSVVVFITNLFLLLSIMKQEELFAAKEAYRELQTLYQMEEAHYHELEQHSEALAKIRHDFHNQLATIHLLLQSKNYTAARELALRMKEVLTSVASSSSDSPHVT